MKIAVIGAGYVGLVSAVGLATTGQHVRIGESDPKRLSQLEAGQSPIYEAGLERLMREAIANGLLTFFGDNTDAVKDADVVLLALPTPRASDGSADLNIIEGALRSLATSLPTDVVVILKSTVPVGTVRRFQSLLDELRASATVVSNPEFLREGSAVSDFFHPDRIVIGTNNQAAADRVTEMYQGIQSPVIVTSPESSEMIKYASNAYLATRITFANAIANLCEATGADASDVLSGMGHDRRIGHHFLNPGPGYGGSCFPKDTRALVAIAEDAGYDFSLLRGVIAVNELQVDRIIAKVAAAVPSLSGARVGLWGLAFKAGTDDTRESPAIRLAQALTSQGAHVVAYDPAVQSVDVDSLVIADNAIDAARQADVLLIATEWPEFAGVNLRTVRDTMNGDVVVDARNLLDPISVTNLGMKYIGVGR